MAKKYFDNYKLTIAIEYLFGSIKVNECLPIHDVINLESGDTLPKHQMKEGIYYVYGGGGKTENQHNKFNIDFDTIGIGRVGARCGCVFNIEKRSWVTDNLLYVKEFDKRFSLNFLKHFLSYSNLNKYANNAMQPVISKTGIQSIKIPLLDYEKQLEIGCFIDEVENDNFNNVTKFPLLNEKFNLLDKIDVLNEENQVQSQLLAKLKQSILQEAIQGKLTSEWRKQNPNTEPAAELLKRIEVKKEKLIKEKKIKKEKPLLPIAKEEIPFELPEGWEWCRLGEICHRIHYGFTASAKPEKQEVRLLRITDIQENKVDWDTVPGCDFTQSDIDNYLLSKDDIVIARTGGTIGKTFLVNEIPVKSLFASYLIRAVPSNYISPKFLKIFMESPIYWQQLYDAAWGAGQPNVNATSLSNLIVPFPSHSEQQAIVEKVEVLLEKCSQLQAEIENQNKYSKDLLKALFNETFGGKETYE
ncbi:MAG: restriction endonuclease subunit S [Treponema sp.]|nr:restriction endonuclease subunit S [Treponema sp.]